jgi:hypothetical protein
MICCAAFAITGCAPKTVTKIEYRDVKVPVRCDVTVPPRPAYNPDAVTGVVDILEYAEMLEALLRACTGDAK